MSTIKNIVFLAICLLVGLGIGKGFIMWLDRSRGGHDFSKQEDPLVITGVGDAPGNRGFALSAASMPSLSDVLKQAEQAFATCVGIEYSTAITHESLANAVHEAHRHHMSVVLLPPAKFSLTNPYPRPLEQVAADAQEAGVDFLCISWIGDEPDAAYWREQADAVRKVYRGKTIYAAGTQALTSIDCWDAGDLVGVIGPVPFNRHVSGALTVHDMRVLWDSAITSYESLAKVNGDKKLALLHMNILPDAAPLPGEAATKPLTPDEVQRLRYEALLIETKGRSDMTQVMLFDWDAAGAPERLGADLMAKFKDAWDPKKPRLPEVPVDGAAPDAGDVGDEPPDMTGTGTSAP